MSNIPNIEDLKRSGVYSITNIVNGKRYIGSTTRTIIARWKDHRRALIKNKHCSPRLQLAWNKYGEEALRLEILELCEPIKCVTREQWYIDQFRSADSKIGYNICPRAASKLGIKCSDETKAKISAAHARRKMNKKTRAAMKEAQRKRTLILYGPLYKWMSKSNMDRWTQKTRMASHSARTT